MYFMRSILIFNLTSIHFGVCDFSYSIHAERSMRSSSVISRVRRLAICSFASFSHTAIRYDRSLETVCLVTPSSSAIVCIGQWFRYISATRLRRIILSDFMDRNGFDLDIKKG